jgi:hypothetical protein
MVVVVVEWGESREWFFFVRVTRAFFYKKNILNLTCALKNTKVKI